MRQAAGKARLDVITDSAGTGDWHRGDPPDQRAQAMARSKGTDISDLRARQVQASDFDRFDLILAADESNLANLLAMRPPGSRAEIALMLDQVAGRQGEAVSDPYYGNEDHFAEVWDDVSAVAEALVERFTQR
jgi:protein-tyrosine phosphatase